MMSFRPGAVQRSATALRPSSSQDQRSPSGSARLLSLYTVLGGILAAVTLAPAQWVADGLDKVTEGRVRLYETRGSVWQGSGVLVLSGGSGSTQLSRLPGRVQWNWRLNGAMPFVMQLSSLADCCTSTALTLDLTPRWGGFDASIKVPGWTLPASLLIGLGTPWNTLGLKADMVLHTDKLTISSRGGRVDLAGLAQLDVLSASSKLSTIQPMGSYRLSIRGSDVSKTTPSVELSTLDGALGLTGTGQWVGQRLRFVGRATVTDAKHESALQNILNIVGRRDGASAIITIG